MHNYLKSNVFYSEYLSDDDNKYLTDNIENIEIIAAPEEREKYLHDNYNIPKYSGTLNTKLKSGCIAMSPSPPWPPYATSGTPEISESVSPA